MRRAVAALLVVVSCLLGASAFASETISYTYDALGRLVAVSSAGSVNNGEAVNTTYDPAGNRVSQTVTGAGGGGGGGTADLSIGNASVTEGGQLVFTVTRSGNLSNQVTVNFATSNGTASSTGDYTSNADTLTFVANDTSETITVNTTNDSTPESNETLSVTLSGASSGANIVTAVGTGTIIDNDTPAFSIADATASEGNTLSFAVTVGPHSGSVSVTATTSPGTALAGSDYTHKTQTVTFTSSQTSKNFSVVTAEDAVQETTETLTVTLSNPSSGTTIADGSATGTINDDDMPAANLAIGNASVTEGGQLSFTVTRSGVTNTAVSASYATANGTASSASDYTAKSGTVSFAANDTSETITVNTTNDTNAESNETLTVTLSNPSSGAVITTATGTGTIIDNDTVITLTTFNLEVLPEHEATYACDYGSVPQTGIWWGACWLTSNYEIVYDVDNATVYEIDTGYSTGTPKILKVLSAYYGTSD